MIKVFINKYTHEVTRRYYIESMFNSIKENEDEYVIITSETLLPFKAYYYDINEKAFKELVDNLHKSNIVEEL